MVGEEDRNPALFGRSYKQDRNRSRERVDVNDIWTLLVEDSRECCCRLGVAPAVKFLEHMLAFE
jgi:hypothetical protein